MALHAIFEVLFPFLLCSILCSRRITNNLTFMLYPFSVSMHVVLVEPTCAYARWAHMHRILYVRNLTKIHTRQKVILGNTKCLSAT